MINKALSKFAISLFLANYAADCIKPVKRQQKIDLPRGSVPSRGRPPRPLIEKSLISRFGRFTGFKKRNCDNRAYLKVKLR